MLLYPCCHGHADLQDPKWLESLTGLEKLQQDAAEAIALMEAEPAGFADDDEALDEWTRM